MNVLTLGRYAFCSGVAIAILAGCGGQPVPVAAPVVGPAGIALMRKASVNEKVIYNFFGGSGAHPIGRMINVGGALYGTAPGGGAGCGSAGCGTVFRITTSGSLKVLYRFQGSFPNNDGAAPWAGPTYVNGVFYGTTVGGGAYESGTVFKLTTSGKETVLHSFPYGGSGSPPDGCDPAASLTNVKGTLYGTTTACGTKGGGTVFKITTSGAETVIHKFGSGTDGWEPHAGLTNVNGTLYSTTRLGGTGECPGSSGGCGTVYSLSGF